MSVPASLCRYFFYNLSKSIAFSLCEEYKYSTIYLEMLESKKRNFYSSEHFELNFNCKRFDYLYGFIFEYNPKSFTGIFYNLMCKQLKKGAWRLEMRWKRLLVVKRKSNTSVCSASNTLHAEYWNKRRLPREIEETRVSVKKKKGWIKSCAVRHALA